MTPGSRYCHRCGAAAGAAPVTGPSRGLAAIFPWAVAALALASLIALVVGQRFGTRPDPAGDVLDGSNAQGSTALVNPGAPGATMPRAPDISSMTPAQRAERLYDRIMTEHEAGRTEGVRSFMPMAVAAYEMLAPLSLDQRYDLGRIGEVGGDAVLARAQADTILATRSTHLLGLALAIRLAQAASDEPRTRQLESRLLAAESAERAAALPEYLLHRADIDSAMAVARRRGR
jgi:hypothetical protein